MDQFLLSELPPAGSLQPAIFNRGSEKQLAGAAFPFPSRSDTVGQYGRIADLSLLRIEIGYQVGENDSAKAQKTPIDLLANGHISGCLCPNSNPLRQITAYKIYRMNS